MIGQGALPYPGLRAFARDESHLFFGREHDVDELIDRLANTRFLAVIGPSGSGKSSLVRTGLLSALDLGYFARAGAQWVIAEMSPTGQPLENLAAALDAVRSQTAAAIPIGLLRRLLAEGPRSIVRWREAGNLAPPQNLLILVDQFEELFRYGDYAAREEAEAFVALLLQSAREAEARIHVVLTMRSEYLGACALIPGLAEEINRGLYLTPRMSREACRAAIEGPARIVGLTIEPALVNQILNDLAAFAPWEQEAIGAQGQRLSRRADQLPLMQHLLNRLWLTTQPDDNGKRTLKLADYQRLGGLNGALDAHGAEVLASLADDDRRATEQVLRALVTGPDPTSAVRRPCRFDELVANLDGDAERTRRILDVFRSPGCNFLRPPSERPLGDSTIVDISHESLIRQWSVLAGWLQTEAGAGANWQRLAHAQQHYGAGEGDLLAGVELDALANWWDSERPNAAWAGRHGGHFKDVHDFLSSSRAAKMEIEKRRLDQAKRERRKLAITLAVVSGLFIASLGAFIYANILGGELNAKRVELMQAEENAKQLEEKAKQFASERMAAERARDAARADTQREMELKAELDRKTKDVLAKEAEAKVRLKQAIDQSTMILSVVGQPQHLMHALEYCKEHSNEMSCRILQSGSANGGDGGRRQ